MKKDIYCNCSEHCGAILNYTIICDTCGDNLDMADIKLIMPIKMEYFGTRYDFCNFKCLSDFINNELKKEKTR